MRAKMKNYTSAFLISLLILVKNADCIRCFECRSDVTRDCGDPFNPHGLPTLECSHLSTTPVVMCYKASQYVGSRGGYVTVRGCAPFNTDSFSAGFQRGMAGTYWRGSSSFSLCDYNNCNSAKRAGVGAAGAVAILMTSIVVANL